MIFKLFYDQSPKTCLNFQTLCKNEYKGKGYKNNIFHRIIGSFMAQTGDII